jgi:quinol monooxygenase YgiN
MRQVMVRYTVRPECAEENARLIRDVFASLARESPADLSYASYRLDDGVSFLHIATVRDEQTNPLRALPAFQAFVAGIRERCATPPATTVLQEVGSYSHLGA